MTDPADPDFTLRDSYVAPGCEITRRLYDTMADNMDPVTGGIPLEVAIGLLLSAFGDLEALVRETAVP